MIKPKNPCPYHADVELIRRGRADWYCSKCKRNMMMELVFIHQALEQDKKRGKK